MIRRLKNDPSTGREALLSAAAWGARALPSVAYPDTWLSTLYLDDHVFSSYGSKLDSTSAAYGVAPFGHLKLNHVQN